MEVCAKTWLESNLRLRLSWPKLPSATRTHASSKCIIARANNL